MQLSCSEQGAQASWDPPRHLSARSGQGAPRTSGRQACGSAASPTPPGRRLWFGLDPEVHAPPRPSVRSAGLGSVCAPHPWVSVCAHLRVMLQTYRPALPQGPPGLSSPERDQGPPASSSPGLPSLVSTGTPGGSPRTLASRAAPTPDPGLQLPPPSPSPWPHPHYEQRPGPPSIPRGPAVFWMPPRRSRDSQGRFGTQDHRDRMGATTHHGGTPAWRAHAPLTHPQPSGRGTASSCRGPSRLQSEE